MHPPDPPDPPATAAPAASPAFLASLLEGLPSPVFVKDSAHRWILLNAAFCEFMGRRAEDLLGKSDFDFFPPDEARVFWAKDDEVFAAGGVNENEERFTDAAGRTHVILTRKSVIEDDAGNRFLLGVIGDITALREATDQLQKVRGELEERVLQRTAEVREANARLRDQDARRAAFLDLLGHELRNPLTALRASVGLLERVPAGAPQAERARGVLGRQVHHLGRLCDDLLDAARITHGKLALHRAPLELSGVVRGACDDLRSMFEAAGVALALPAPGADVPVLADSTRIAQAVGNLLHNALKYTARGGHVRVSVRRAGGFAEVVVADDGAGMAAGDLVRVFEPFVQGGGERAGERGGLGLGLSLVKGLVEAHGGAVTARSPGPGRGLEVTVSLPLARDPVVAVAAEVAPASPRGPVRVVLIEDNADARDTLADLLRLDGHEVWTAEDARSGLAAVRAIRPDAVLCDLGLPDLDGCEVARTLRSDPATSPCRLIALSGYAQPEDVQRAHEAGFDFHLPKPPSQARINAVLPWPAGLQGDTHSG